MAWIYSLEAQKKCVAHGWLVPGFREGDWLSTVSAKCSCLYSNSATLEGPPRGLMIGDTWTRCPKMISNQDHNKCHPEEILRAVDGLAEMLFDLFVHPTLPAAPPPPDLSSPAYDQLCCLLWVC